MKEFQAPAIMLTRTVRLRAQPLETCSERGSAVGSFARGSTRDGRRAESTTGERHAILIRLADANPLPDRSSFQAGHEITKRGDRPRSRAGDAVAGGDRHHQLKTSFCSKFTSVAPRIGSHPLSGDPCKQPLQLPRLSVSCKPPRRCQAPRSGAFDRAAARRVRSVCRWLEYASKDWAPALPVLR